MSSIVANSESMSRPSFDVHRSFGYYLNKLINSTVNIFSSNIDNNSDSDNNINDNDSSNMNGAGNTLTVGLDEALVKFSNQLNDDAVNVYYQIEDCYKCSLIPLSLLNTSPTSSAANNRVGPSLNSSALVTSKQRVQLELRLASTNKRVCRFDEQFDEHAHYTLAINGATNASSRFVECELTQTQQGTCTLCPIVVLLCLFVLLCVGERVYHTMRRYLCRCGTGTHIVTRNSCQHVQDMDATIKIGQPHLDMIDGDNSDDGGGDNAIITTTQVVGANRDEPQQQQQQQRIESLDVFRGLTIGAMIFVNYGGAGYRWLEHSVWDGVTLADFVFPYFIFGMGVSIALSSVSVRCDNYCATVWRVLRRSLAMLALGLCLNSRNASNQGQLSLLRVPGVMQRFAISYGVVALVHISSRVLAATIRVKRHRHHHDSDACNHIDECDHQHHHQSSVVAPTMNNTSTATTTLASNNTQATAEMTDTDVTNQASTNRAATRVARTRATVRALLGGACACTRRVTHTIVRDGPELVLTLLVLATYTYFTLCFDYDPHCPAGYTGPGGASEHGLYANCTGGAAAWLDRHLLGESHLYADEGLARVYGTKRRHDPEGLLGVTMSIVLTLIGLQCGKQLRKPAPMPTQQQQQQQQQQPATVVPLLAALHRQRLMSWLRWTLVSALVALISACFVPVNKRLWSLSFVTVTGAAAICTMAACYVLVDVARVGHSQSRTPRPAVLALLSAAGKNSIFLYVAHSMCSQMLPWYFAVDETSHATLLARLTWSTTLWLLIAYWMWLRRIFITL